ncbi:MAG TPA: hypothetical protein VGL93_15780 [Streptosporangiaceae bacterium]
MLAIIAAVVFAISLVFHWADVSLGSIITSGTLVTIGLVLLALHLAGIGPEYRARRTTATAGTRRRFWR